MWDLLISGPVLSCCKIGTPQCTSPLLLIKDNNAYVFLVTFELTNLLIYVL